MSRAWERSAALGPWMEGEDMRMVSVRQARDLLEVGEHTDGPATELCYGSGCHRHWVSVRGADKIAASLGCGPGQVFDATCAFLGDGSCCLADLMDLFDRCGVAYGYRASMGSVEAFRLAL